MKRNFLKITVALAIVFTTLSCDKDYNSVGSDIVGDDHFDLEKYEVENLIAYSKATGAVQSNNLPINSLGVYENPALGTTTASFVTQLQLARNYERPETIIGTNITMKSTDSVYLYIPYFSQNTRVIDENTKLNVFKLESIYGSSATAFDLKIYENGYYLGDFGPSDDFINGQKHYSDESAKFDNNIGSQLNTSSDPTQNTAFKFSDKEIALYKSKLKDDGTYVFVDKAGVELTNQFEPSLRVIKERMDPGMWIALDKNVIKSRILDGSLNGKLYNNNVFKEYFKGLYFKAQQTAGGSGAMAMLDFSKGYVVVQYHSDIATTDSENVVTIKNEKRTLKLNFKGNTVNLIDHLKSSTYQVAVDASNSVLGEEKLWIKGNDGSVAFIDLFGVDEKEINSDDILVDVVGGNGVPDELDELRLATKLNKWLVNDAFLTFYVDKTSMSNTSISEPRRILLFDATNNRPILDYVIDMSTAQDPKNNKVNFGGIVEVENVDNGRAVKYQIRIANHIRNLIKGTDLVASKNIRLGLCVTENINIAGNVSLKTPISISTDVVKYIPVGNVLNPLGTVLYGNNVAPANEDKKLKLQIFFTKPN
ncbi:DUF4270 domain-containing protein [Flavobacterium ardleyense]|uniref:DUF4270 domain-containing protein n=1 Tax=Flavobacterium ardleyense TaxID=2038737 RepID=A0ABW5Z8X9_9FLAO